MSGSSGPNLLASSASGGLSVAEREIARQRRRHLQESRRQVKARSRRERLPSIPSAWSSSEQNVGLTIDFPVAPSVLGSMPRENTSYPRRPMTSSVQGDYAGSVSGYVSRGCRQGTNR